MKLTPRLMTIAKMIPKCDTVADIGTDHGYIPIYCVKNNISKKAIACDVNEGPLKIAKMNMEKYGCEDNVSTLLSDGLEKLKKDSADTVVIAGMGGLLINSILDNGKHILKPGIRFILQPMLAIKEVRKYLYDNGFDIVREKLAREGNKIYNVLEAVYTEDKKSYTDFDVIVGDKLYISGDEHFKDYMNMKINTVRNIIRGISMSDDKSGIDEYETELKQYLIALGEDL